MRVLVLDQIVAPLALLQAIHLLVLYQVNIVKTDNCSYAWEGGEFFHKKDEVDRFELIRIAKNADYFEFIVDKFLVLEAFENSANMNLL